MPIADKPDPPKVLRTDLRFPRNQNVQLKVDLPFKRTIRLVAAEMGVSLNDLIRQAVRSHLEQNWPGYRDLYRRILEETQKEIEKDG